MKPEFPPETLKVYQLIKRGAATMYFMNTGTGNLGIGFFNTRDDAEHARTIEVLKCSNGDEFYVFELEIPNPAIKNDF